jgi:hypothetical protein
MNDIKDLTDFRDRLNVRISKLARLKCEVQDKMAGILSPLVVGDVIENKEGKERYIVTKISYQYSRYVVWGKKILKSGNTGKLERDLYFYYYNKDSYNIIKKEN